MISAPVVETPPANHPQTEGQPLPPKPRAFDSSGLFQGQREICIEHDGVQYRLRITRRNKLILHK
jgi:hemin uptake protein HemP